MTAGEAALLAFTACNSVRVFAYLPQILKIARDTGGATAISYVTWILFALSHLSTVLYAALSLGDGTMALVFAANTACCVAIVAVTAWKRRALRRTASPGPRTGGRLDVRSVARAPAEARSPAGVLRPSGRTWRTVRPAARP